MKTIATNILFSLYVVLVIAAIVSYIIWLMSLGQTDKTFELVMFVLIGIVFLLSLYLYYACDTFTFPSIIIFFAFVVVMAYTFLTSRQEVAKINRRLAFILGLLSVIPVMISVILNYVNESKPLSPANLE